jgi:hypothetical protein
LEFASEPRTIAPAIPSDGTSVRREYARQFFVKRRSPGPQLEDPLFGFKIIARFVI